MNDVVFAASPAPAMPRHNRSMAIVTVFLHLILLLMLIGVTTRPVRVSPAGVMQTGIAAYVPGPVGTAGTSEAKPVVERKQATIIARAAKTAPKQDQADTQAAGGGGTPGAQAGSGPVRLGTGGGGSLTLLTKIAPTYPAIMQTARVPGLVVLDAIIHHDGTIGDVTVLQSTNDAFAQAAIAAVKRWRYTPIPYEGILTVTVNFTLPR
jgi:TonB family protein